MKAWAANLNAKKMQTTLNVLAYNLAQLLNREIETQLPEGELQNKSNEMKKEKRMEHGSLASAEREASQSA